MAKNVAGDLLSQSYELQKKFNELFRQVNQTDGYPFVFNKLMDHLQDAVEGRFLSPVGQKNYPKFSTKDVNGGYKLELVGEGTSYETILSIQSAGGTRYALNNKFVVNRPIFDLEGSEGVIVTILEPHKNGYSNDILVVRINEKIFHLKMKEINLI